MQNTRNKKPSVVLTSTWHSMRVCHFLTIELKFKLKKVSFWRIFTHFLDALPQFVGGQIHSMEVGEDVAALNVFSDELELAERTLGIVVVLQIGQRDLEHAALQSLGSNLCSLGTVDQSLADLAAGEHGWSLNVIPIFASEGIDDLLLGSLFASFG